MTTNQQRRDSRAKMLMPTFIMGDVHEDVFKSVFARSVYSYGSLAQRARPFPPVTTYRLDKMSGFSEVNVKTIGSILRGLYEWGFLTPFVRSSKTRASITPKGWAYVFFYLNRGDFTDDRFKPFIGSANDGPYVFAEFVKDTGLPDLWFAKLCRDVWDHEESFKPEGRRFPWPWPQDNGASVVDGLNAVEPDKGAAPLRPSEAGQFMPCLGSEHPIDAIIETHSPRMTDEEVEDLYLKRAQDPAQLQIARAMLARDYRQDSRFENILDINGFIKEHLTPVEIIRFEHERMWQGPAHGVETLVQRMSKAKQFKPTTLADMAPNRLGISDMDAPGHGVSKIAAALRLEDEAAAARNLGADGQTTLGEAGISLTPPEPDKGAGYDRGGTWYSGDLLHIVRDGFTLCGQRMTVDFIVASDYDEQHVAYLEREVDHLVDKLNLLHDVQYYRQIDEDMKLLHNKRGYTREHQRVGEVEHTVTVVGPIWTDAIVAGLVGFAGGLAVMGFGIWSGLLVFAS